MRRKKENGLTTFAKDLVRKKTKREQKRERPSLASFLIKLAIFAGLVVAYFFLVLIFLDRWLKHLFDQSKPLYALTALGLIASQGVILEVISALLMKFVQSKID